jgi:1,4-dihydroxy-2-naphthoyl-CoA hydrolase
MERNAPASSELLAQLPYAATLGIDFKEVTAEQVVASLDWSPDRCTVAGMMHGGVLMALADTAGGVLAYLNLPAGATTSTVEFKINFFQAVRGGTVRAICRRLFVGKSFIVVQTDLEDDRGRVAQSTQTQAVLAGRNLG